jgi:hypothetical protein
MRTVLAPMSAWVLLTLVMAVTALHPEVEVQQALVRAQMPPAAPLRPMKKAWQMYQMLGPARSVVVERRMSWWAWSAQEPTQAAPRRQDLLLNQSATHGL